jgi:NAD(P)-dependent dehydrogenase (short-subunit alcohol dehydrogenase family)
VNPTAPLAGKSVFVTGGARRLGRAIALTLAQAGADVAISYRSSESDAAATAAAIAALGRKSLAIPCDVRSEPSVRAAVAQVTAAFGRLDILVNNAAVFASAALESLTLDQWDTVFETNARGPFLVAREALPHLRKAQGRIINMGSLGGLHAWAGHAHYCASKAALHMLTQAMAKAFAPDVSVNCVAPGWIALQEVPADLPQNPSQTKTGKDASSDENFNVSDSLLSESERRAELQAARFASKTPMGRNGNSDDVAQAVLFFSTGPHFITGQTLVVDGGLGLS